MTLHSDTRLMILGAVVVVGGGTVVAFVALDHAALDPSIAAHAVADAPPPTDAEPAPSYSELRDSRRGKNGWMYRGVSAELSGRLPGLEAAVEQSEAERTAALEARRALRAYEGAPPRVPHAVTQQTVDCAGCHTAGGVIAGKVAPKMSHPPYPTCTQCHVPVANPRPESPDVPPATAVESTFVGLAGPGHGTRAWPGAPPTIPHTTLMRSDCSSCHGTSGKQGLRTPHPFQVSCTQCHVPNAVLDQRPPWVRDEESKPNEEP